MPRKRNTNSGEVPPADLAYAVMRLIAMGKTTTQQVRQLAGERSERIAQLEAELAALRRSAAGAAAATGRAKAAKPRKQPVAVGKTITRADGRPFTRSAKVARARKVQGQYMGYLRGVEERQRERFKAIAHENGVPAAVVALKAHLGKK